MASQFFSLLFLLSLSLSLSTSASQNHHHQRSSSPSSASGVSDQILKACKGTRYPAVCKATLSSRSPGLGASPTPRDLIQASISSASTDLQTARSKAQAILDASASDLNRTNAAKNCLHLLGFSNKRLSATASALDAAALADARAWGSAALLYQYDCWSALKYVNGTKQVAETMTFLVHLTNLTSNALSMLTALQRFGNNTSAWGPPQTERDGYWGPPISAGQVWPWSKNGVPSDLVPNVWVCKEGCKYQTVQSAVDAAPDNGSERFVIYIKEGVYREMVRVPFEKTKLVFLGDGMGKTVITGNLSADYAGVTTYNTATVGVFGDGFMASNLTFSNDAAPGTHQAVAFLCDSDHAIIQNVEFLGHQDTLYAHSLRQLYKSCRIFGTVDFIFGNSASIFQDTLILVVPRQVNPAKGESDTVSAHGRTDPAQSTGFVFYNCTVNGTAEYYHYYYQKPALHKSYLGRPWKEYSRAVFIKSYLDVLITREGWLPWSGDFALSTLFYGEFQNAGPGANPGARVPWSSQIPKEHVGAYSVQNFIQL